MDIKSKRKVASIVIVIATILIAVVIANFVIRDFDIATISVMACIGIGSLIAIILALSAFEATKEESAEEYQNKIKEFMGLGYVVSTSTVKIVPFLNTRVRMGQDFWGTRQVVGKEKFDDFKITILLDSFFLSQAEVETNASVSVIRFEEYVVVHDKLNDNAVWLVM